MSLPSPALAEAPPASAPARARRDALAALVASCAAAAWPVLCVARVHALIVSALLGAIALAVALRGRRDLVALPALTALVAALMVVPALRQWPAPMLLGVLVVLAVGRFRAPWLARGRLDRAIGGWVVACVAVSAGALVAWWALTRPDLSDLTRVPSGFHPVVLAAGIVGWAACTAAAEELFFRGALQLSLVRAFGAGGVVIQALAFGAMHFHGFPRGWSGVALASVYGLMMGALRQRSGGLLAPWVAHLAADVTIVGILMVALR